VNAPGRPTPLRSLPASLAAPYPARAGLISASRAGGPGSSRTTPIRRP
jgi:hypothetical protein